MVLKNKNERIKMKLPFPNNICDVEYDGFSNAIEVQILHQAISMGKRVEQEKRYIYTFSASELKHLFRDRLDLLDSTVKSLLCSLIIVKKKTDKSYFKTSLVMEVLWNEKELTIKMSKNAIETFFSQSKSITHIERMLAF